MLQASWTALTWSNGRSQNYVPGVDFPVWTALACVIALVVVVVVFLGFRDKPRMSYSLAGLLYRPIWTFQVRPPNASAPADVFRTPCLHACRRVPHSSSESWNFMGGEMKPHFA
jgi:hypothetical protein